MRDKKRSDYCCRRRSLRPRAAGVEEEDAACLIYRRFQRRRRRRRRRRPPPPPPPPRRALPFLGRRIKTERAQSRRRFPIGKGGRRRPLSSSREDAGRPRAMEAGRGKSTARKMTTKRRAVPLGAKTREKKTMKKKKTLFIKDTTRLHFRRAATKDQKEKMPCRQLDGER